MEFIDLKAQYAQLRAPVMQRIPSSGRGVYWYQA